MEEAIGAYLEHARVYYAGSREYLNCRKTLEWVLLFSGITDPNQLDAERLETVQGGLIAEDLSRGYINQTISRARRIWKWFERKGIVDRGTVEHLKTVPGLQKGRTSARETEPVGPVAVDTVNRTIAGLEEPHATIVALMLYTGARISEILVMRTADIDRSEDDRASFDDIDAAPLWWYEPSRHKTGWRGQSRPIPLDDRAQALLMPLLRPFAPEDYLFPASSGLRHLTASATYHAIRRVCEREGLPLWKPHQTRHHVATAADRAGATIEEIQQLLGHADPASTRRYIQKRNERGRIALAKIRRKDSENEPSRTRPARPGDLSRPADAEPGPGAGRHDARGEGERRAV